MNLTEAVKHRLEVREYADEPVSGDIERAVVEAARLSPSTRNRQDWHFLLVDGDALNDLATASTIGKWVVDAAFAVVVLSNEYPSHGVDSSSERQISCNDQADYSLNPASSICHA
jgi:nitroreductase